MPAVGILGFCKTKSHHRGGGERGAGARSPDVLREPEYFERQCRREAREAQAGLLVRLLSAEQACSQSEELGAFEMDEDSDAVMADIKEEALRVFT